MKTEDFEYYYLADVTYVHDGDSIFVKRDKGFKDYTEDFRIRLKDVYCPEITGIEKQLGFYVRDRLAEKVFGKRVVCHSYKYKRTFERYVAIVYVDGVNISEWLIEQGYGTRYKKDLPAFKKSFKLHLV